MGHTVCSTEQELFQCHWSCLLSLQCPARDLFSDWETQESCSGTDTLESHGFGFLYCWARMFSHTLKRD